MEEIWKPVPYEPFDAVYSVSNLGRVKPNTPSRFSKNKAAFLKPTTRRKYLHVSLYADGRRMSAFVHKMVALAFIGPKPFPTAIVCHKDDIRHNNQADNLEWGTTKSNADTRDANGHVTWGSKNGHARLTENDVVRIRALYAQGGITQQDLARQFAVSGPTVNNIVRRKSWCHC